MPDTGRDGNGRPAIISLTECSAGLKGRTAWRNLRAGRASKSETRKWAVHLCVVGGVFGKGRAGEGFGLVGMDSAETTPGEAGGMREGVIPTAKSRKTQVFISAESAGFWLQGLRCWGEIRPRGLLFHGDLRFWAKVCSV